ncbi:MAG: tRNA preQ1(34) S-adenosylmethionine ribosyltransferase-isomerase QueA [Candidatus Marinimicrobia bacterium]|nr:tRNA preQ1(34) S-adenosylmethionine ribosyltransferase-isomerase QueA [Candidatus Neomarinimicrobiota bacterium]MCF7830257.1 tRNA preQ1(34) S-adenosylmethionine ribosyltransferase-isomerase QueA [Candidatus Neomarinimicrobiota bacterium]MCF7882284.1 tRNA preQ1(34) S-adenosylmethionine ribosyltransferase-isomerase QueA [Candidatus Neomarinimicrobiota bacterium]
MAFNQVDPILQSDKVHPDDFEFELPEDKIAKYPADPRDSAQMMVLHRTGESPDETVFTDVTEYLEKGDVLVVNNTRVFPARFDAIKVDNGDPIDIFLIRELNPTTWEAMVDPARKVRIGNSIRFGDSIECDVIDNTVSSGRVLRFQGDGEEIRRELEKIGKAPLPPYIDRESEEEDKERYQTVYAKEPGSVVAPSAGLHFTESLLDKLRDKGIEIVEITLHLGLEAYEPITISDLSKYDMQGERFEIQPGAIDRLNKAKKSGNRVVAVGASTVRALESNQYQGEIIVQKENWTDLFIYPPYDFQIVDGLITNFQQSRSATMILQSAFYYKDGLLDAYQHAMEKDYKFLSFGDAMLII